MTSAGQSTVLDARALDLLDELLDDDAGRRDSRLQDLQAQDPQLHARLLRLLQASQDPGSSQQLGAVLVGQGAAPAPPAAAGDRVAGYRLLRELGRGGMASVWLAERADGGLKREVAIKLPLASMATLPAAGQLAERFERERDVLAALDHPHIARLFDAGVADGRPYIVLEAVDGRSLIEHAQAEGLTLRQRLALFLQVLAAVEHAHAHMVVHRDLKPSNVLVDRQGQVKLLDFGIAKLLSAPVGAADLTQDAGALLTPRYAAPEQLLGQAVTAATDVFSAGVLLYELLTGRLPWAVEADPGSAPSLGHWVQAVLQTDPLPPRVSVDIDTVLLKALGKAPQDRYASIERFAEDLRRLLSNRPILARPVPAWRRAALLLRRHRAISAAALVGSLLLLLAGGTAWLQTRETAAQSHRADAVRDFVFAMVADAEPGEGRDDVTGREIVAAAVARARSQLAADPWIRGDLLSELGRLQFRLQQPAESVGTLEEALALLLPRAEAGSATLNRTRALLARSLFASDPGRAIDLAQQALDQCTAQDKTCAEARAHALYALTSVASWQNREADALRHARAMVDQTALAFGPSHASLVQALEAQAATARNLGELQEAEQALARALALAAQHPMKAAVRDRLDLLQAVIDIDLGRFAPATDRLATLAARSTTPNERSTQLRILALAELGLGRPERALGVALASERALGAVAPGVATWLARQAQAVAASSAGRHDEATRTFAQVYAGLTAAGYKADSGSLLRLRRMRAEAMLRGGRNPEALAALQALRPDAVRQSPHEQGQILDALACAHGLQGQADAARSHYALAEQAYQRTLPDDHPLRLRNRALLAQLDGQDPASPAVLRYRQTWAADSPRHQARIAECRQLI